MNKQKSIIIAVAGVSLLAVSQVRAQISYNGDDLLLNFRNTSLINPVSGSDLEVDLGNINTFVGSAPAGVSETVVSASLVTGLSALQFERSHWPVGHCRG
jgi:hypothetical protein